jgi:hypothetical protein
VVDPIAAIVISLLVHVPGPDASVNVMENPAQIGAMPPIGAGSGLINTVVVTKQPVGIVYVIFAVPPATPVIRPVLESIVATAELLVLHTPVPVASLRVVELPWHIVKVPVMIAGNGLMLITAVPNIVSEQDVVEFVAVTK